MKIRNKSDSVFIFAFVFFFFALLLASSPRVDEKGLVAWWKLDESKAEIIDWGMSIHLKGATLLSGSTENICSLSRYLLCLIRLYLQSNFWSNDPILKKYVTLVLFFDIVIACL